MNEVTPFVYQQLIDKLKTSFSSVSDREIINAMVDLEVKLRVQTYYASQCREGLKFYAPGPFWTEVLKDTKAAEDQGKHAEWILRLTDPEAT
jgi:hypothetical protein